ncbi:BnaA06g16860D [Brassica napus]|uniref:BnaA06g16860D protein n=1 Tax=Brassica napus TaxID=3708 RepID=A0A078HGK4_BRANA|nr:BnaA06g16860D [Brassica napus]
MVSKESCRNEIRAAIGQLSERCLHSAAKWAGEQLVGIEQDPSNFTPSNTRFQRGSSSIRRRFSTNESISTPQPSVGFSQAATPLPEEDEVIDGDLYHLAKSYFNCREYRRASHVLRDQMSKKSVFLRCYSLYLAGEKRKEEEMIELEGSLGKSDAINRELVSLERELSALKRTGAIDSFGLYLYGVVLKEKGNETLARASLVESVNSYPWNWNAWSELQSLCTSIEILNSLNLSNHWMKEFFLASAYQELRMHTESLAKYEYLQGIFSFSNYIQAQTAKAQYSLREFDQVEIMFEDLLRNDPYRVEDMDLYSNVLYAKEASVDINPCDYRAWYGLGQAYEMMGMPFYALHYFRKSIFFLPNDSRLWIAMAKCYQTEQIYMLEEAIKCYKRAVSCTDTEGIALNQLAKLHQKLGRDEEAAVYFEKDVERMDSEGLEGPNMLEALVFLATHFKTHKKFEEAEVYCTRILDYSGPEKEKAKSLLRGIRMEKTGFPSMDMEHFPL